MYEHLVRVAALLTGWGGRQELQAVGLCHACYGTVSFCDRFTGCAHTPLERDVPSFTELTAANELDVVGHNPAIAARYGAALRQLFAGARPWLTDAAWQAWSRSPGSDPAGLPEQV